MWKYPRMRQKWPNGWYRTDPYPSASTPTECNFTAAECRIPGKFCAGREESIMAFWSWATESAITQSSIKPCLTGSSKTAGGPVGASRATIAYTVAMELADSTKWLHPLSSNENWINRFDYSNVFFLCLTLYFDKSSRFRYRLRVKSTGKCRLS